MLSKNVRKEAEEKVILIAKYFNKTPIIIKSDIRKIIDKHVSWQLYGHGPALASIGLEREHQYKKIYIAATYVPGYAVKNASNPQTDPLWSTETLEFIHDGTVTRLEKIKSLAAHQYALDLLRVCYQGSTYNCSRCEKCVRTMISLRLLGLSSAAFGEMPSLTHISKLCNKAKGTAAWPVWMQNVIEAQRFLSALKGQM